MLDFEKKFKLAMQSKAPLLDKIMHYIVQRKGKQVRPMFVFLTAGMCGGINESTFDGASLIELLHTATLVHDDVVDDSNMRRGFFSINALWKNKIAVLVGDYLLAKGLLLSVERKHFHLLEIVSNAVRMMSEGELLQLEKARNLDIDEEVYYTIIKNKTASLIASCCAIGAASAQKENPELIERMRELGETIGMAFQIKDDMFDYEKTNKTGKPVGIDIKERKMTLPLIYTLNKVPRTTRKHLINIVKNHNTDATKVEAVINEVMQSGGFDYSVNKMNVFTTKAKSILHAFPESEYKNSLINLIDFTIMRTV
ncbi:MAG: polyprenyl synthetase family protein [Bacteroidetes bacterium]|nr:polyprenyl synthetase family protein [Bacteroidota bacterium]